jgi:hypothetical protein
MRYFLLLLGLTIFVFAPSIICSQEGISELLTEIQKPEVSVDKIPPLSVQADKFRKEFSFKIRCGTAIRKDYDACKNGLEQLEIEEHKQPFYLLLAHYHRTIDREPVKALEVLAPLVVTNDIAEKWVTEQREAAQKAFEKWSKEFEAAKQAKKKKDEIPKRPEGLFVEFPSWETWKLDNNTAAVCLEIATNLMILNRHEEALKIINAVGEKCDKEYKILAAECAADLMVLTNMYDNAITFYNFALRFIHAIRENGDEFVILTADEQQIIKNRINDKRGAIYKLAEQGRFPQEWLDYRESQRKHLEEESLLEAYWMYLDVTKNYPNTFCAEASECYVIKILTMFSNPAFIKEAAKRYDIILDQLEDAKARLRQAKRTAMPQSFIAGLEAYVERLKYVVKMWESTPFGRKALQQAEERAEKFIEKNKYGLYRGEVLFDIGTAYLVSFFDTENGEQWLNRAADWFDNVQQFDKDLKDFELPDSVRKVSTPPKNERYKDRWNNVKMSKPKAGDFFNRRTCSWYWNTKRKDVTLLQGLIAFAKEDYETAEKHWNLLAELDKEFYARQKAAGWENATTLARLIWNLRNKKGSLYATPEEMAAFNDPKQRLTLLIADLNMEMQDYLSAEKSFRVLLNDRDIRNNRNKSAYCTFALATALMMQHKSKEAIKLFEMFGPNHPFDKTPPAPRAILSYAHYQTQHIDQPDKFMNGNRAYEYLVKTYPDTVQADCAFYYRARNYASSGDILTAINTLKLYLQKYPNANYGDYAKKYIKYFEEIKNRVINVLNSINF